MTDQYQTPSPQHWNPYPQNGEARRQSEILGRIASTQDYMGRDLHRLDIRVTALETRKTWKAPAIDWRVAAVIALLILGMTGHITAGEIKQALLWASTK